VTKENKKVVANKRVAEKNIVVVNTARKRSTLERKMEGGEGEFLGEDVI
jgi:hypothetical protein